MRSLSPQSGEVGYGTSPVFGRPMEGTMIRALWPRVGDKLRVELVGADVERGFIDFVRVG